ncbi:MAG: cytosolic protein, partial [Deltaproteobacteria bacterium]|nr:cytosolic protein [Deltaproteobacteria bacterium]
MPDAPLVFEALDREDRARFILDIFHRILIHYALWFTEIRHQMGPDKALEMLGAAWDRGYPIQMRRLSKLLHFNLENNLPEALLNMPVEEQKALLEGVAANWLANDGVWFQTVEFSSGMVDAKRCNDACWGHFSPFEAWSIKRFASIPENAGLEGL